MSFLKKNSAGRLTTTVLIALMLGSSMSGQNSYTFTNCSATGSTGPTQAQINSTYNGTNGAVQVLVQGVQQWTVPLTSLYKIEVWGATAGNARPNIDGRGRKISGEVFITGGTVLNIVVGQKGLVTTQGGNNWKSGGGGASWVYSGNTPYIIGGGGGGAGESSLSSDAPFNQNFHSGTSYHVNTPAQTNTNVGFGGPAGGVLYVLYATGAGGAGWMTDGQESTTNRQNLYNGRGKCRFNNFLGGQASNFFADGGFGGGAAGMDNTGAGGGGGGYTGGPGGEGYVSSAMWGSGGGGSSFWNSNFSNIVDLGLNTDHGRVIITELCNISLVSTANPICAGNSVTLSTNAIGNYTWSTGSNASSIVVTPSVTTNYSLIATSSLNCLAGSVITLTVSPGLPVLAVTSSTDNLCLGKSATLTASGALTYTWSNGVTNGVSFTPSVTTAYTVTGGNGCGTSSAVTSITVAPLPVTVQNTPSIACAGLSSTLVASSAVNSYTWLPVALYTATIVVNPTVNTVYTVTASDGTCSGVATLSLSVLPIPTINVVANTSVTCEGYPVTMSASGGLSYTWSPGNLSGSSVTVYPTGPTLYTVNGVNSVGCITGTTQIVLTETSPLVNITASSTFVCKNDQVTLIATGNAAGYQWTGGPSTSSYQVNPQANAVYTVTGSSQTNTCTTVKTVTVQVYEPVLTITSSTATVCSGKEVTLTASGADSYSWLHNGSTSNMVTVIPVISTVYSVSGSSSSNNITCPVSASVQINVNPNPTVTASSTRTMICKDELTVLNASGAQSYTWSNNSTTASTTVAPVGITIHMYTVTGTDDNGCIDKTTIMIRVITCNGISELNSSTGLLSVFPNPSNGELFITSDSDVVVSLSNATGQELMNIQLDQKNDRKVNLSGLPAGIYFIRLVGQENVIIKKIIVD